MGLYSTTTLTINAAANQHSRELELGNLSHPNDHNYSHSDEESLNSLNYPGVHTRNGSGGSKGGSQEKEIIKDQTWLIGNDYEIPDGKEQTLKLCLKQKIFLTLEDSTTCFVISTMEFAYYQPETCTPPICDPATSSVCTEIVCQPINYQAFDIIEAICIYLFTVEYFLRIFTVPFVPMLVLDQDYFYGELQGVEPVGVTNWEKCKIIFWKIWFYGTKTLNVIDFLAIIPFYIALVTNSSGLGFLRVLRLARVLRIFKLGKYSEGGTLFYNTLAQSAPALLLMLFFLTIMMIIFGSLIFFFEEGIFKVNDDYPMGAYYRPTVNGLDDELSPFASIPVAFYWVVITTTTIGYGDFAPTTIMGRFTAVFAAYIGIICVALPITIIGTNFTNEYERMYGLRNNTSFSHSRNTTMTGSNTLSNKVTPIYEVDEDALSVSGSGGPLPSTSFNELLATKFQLQSGTGTDGKKKLGEVREVVGERGEEGEDEVKNINNNDGNSRDKEDVDELEDYPDGAGLVRVPSIVQPGVILQETRAHSRKSLLTHAELGINNNNGSNNNNNNINNNENEKKAEGEGKGKGKEEEKNQQGIEGLTKTDIINPLNGEGASLLSPAPQDGDRDRDRDNQKHRKRKREEKIAIFKELEAIQITVGNLKERLAILMEE